MGANQITNMVMRIFMRKIISKGIDMSFNAVSKQSGQRGIIGASAPDGQAAQKREMTPEEKQRQKEARKARQAARQARNAMKVTRRVGRM